MSELRTNGHLSNNNSMEAEVAGIKGPGWLQQQGLTIMSDGVAKLKSTQCTISRASPPNPITPPQSWTTSTTVSSALEHFGAAMKKYSRDQTDGSNSNGVSDSNSNSMCLNSQINCAYCGTVGDIDKYFAKSNRKEFCSINCLKAATKKIYEIPASSETKKKHETSLKLKEVCRKLQSGLPNRDQEFLKKHQSQSISSKSALTVEISRVAQAGQQHQKFKSKLIPPVKEPKVSPGPPPTYDWTFALESNPDFQAAHVSSFKLAPVRSLWENVQPGMKLEVENRDVSHSRLAFWVASVIKIQGYKVLLRFEGFGTDSSRDFWANLCTPDVHPVGWCATQNKPLIPPTALTARYTDWRDFLVRRLTGARTIPQNFQDKIAVALKSKFEVGAKLEVVDKNRICRVRYAEVISSIGKRLHLRYYDENDVQEDFWCHENSSLIHPCGWAQTVGQEVYAPPSYKPSSLDSKMKSVYTHLQIEEGMKLEAIDPLNLSAICVATVKKVLKYDYIMVRVDCYEEDANGSDWFCYHLSSTSIFPCGFCASHGISLTPPNGYTKESFNWTKYLEATKAKPAPLQAIHKEPVTHNFSVGMRLEVADLMDPRLICVATISQIIGNLMKIHFDGWEEEYDQWLDASSPDIYPVGWCELVGHKLEAPPVPQPQFVKKPSKTSKKPKKRPIPKRHVGNEPKLKKLKLSNTPHRITSPLHSYEPKEKDDGPSSRASSVSSSSVSSAISRIQTYPQEHHVTSSTGSPEREVKVGISTGTFRRIQECSAIKVQPQVTKIETEPAASDPLLTTVKADPDASGEKFIPKLIDSPPCSTEVEPHGWTVDDVSKFLMLNDCGAHCDSFIRNKVDGPKFLNLAKESIIVLTGMKVGPAVKILDLISQLTRLVNAAKGRKASPK